MERILFTSESVSEGHPDKICDKISDSILDAVLQADPSSFVAVECYATTNFLLIGGEVKTKAKVNYKEIARNVIKEIGYDKSNLGFSYDSVEIIDKIQTQSPDIRRGVENKNILEEGAGDQGIMFGYASNETVGYMPLPIVIAHKLVRIATELRKSGEFKRARPDMKSQVTIDYTEKTPRIKTILMSIQHDEDYNLQEFKNFIVEQIMKPVARSFNMNEDFEVLINPTGRFVIGGPSGDTGLTGRKIIVDTYGGSARHGGGAFSGKDPSKVDRSAAYYARYMAKNLVAAGVADRLEIQLSYAIGVAKPISISVSTFKTAKYSDEQILEIINKIFDARPGAITQQFSLREPSFKYSDISNYGHFGRQDLGLPWEKLDKVDEIRRCLKEFDKKSKITKTL